MSTEIPEGFFDPEIGGFVGALGPIYRRDRDGGVNSGFVVEQRHCNPAQTCHGGWLSTFADVALVRTAALGGSPLVTITLTTDFLDAVRLGEWVESRSGIVHQTSNMVFVQGGADANGRPVLRMNGIFRIIRSRT